MSRQFCIVYLVDSHFRLMRAAASEAATWTMTMRFPDHVQEIEVRDIVAVENNVPRHLGLEITVVVPASDIDNAIIESGRTAETVVSLLSAVARAYAPPIRPFVAYEITPGAAELPLIQWLPMPELPANKTPVPNLVF